MGQPFTVSIPHRLGKAEATRRMQKGLSMVRDRFGQHVSIVHEVWTDDHLDFKVVVVGTTAAGTLDVTDDNVALEVELPFILSLMANKVKGVVEKHGNRLLGNRSKETS